MRNAEGIMRNGDGSVVRVTLPCNSAFRIPHSALSSQHPGVDTVDRLEHREGDERYHQAEADDHRRLEQGDEPLRGSFRAILEDVGGLEQELLQAARL